MKRCSRFSQVSSWRRGVAVGLLSVVLISGVMAAPAWGQTSKQNEIKNNISKLRDQVNEVSEDEADLLNRLDEINGRKAAVEGQIADVQAQMDQAQRELDAANAKLAAAQVAVQNAQADLNKAQDDLKANTERMQEQAVDAYIGKEPTASMSKVIMEADDLRQASAASAYMRQIVADRRDVVEQHRELEGEARDIKRDLVRLEEQAEGERAVVADRQAQLASQKTQLDGLRAQVQSEADAQAALLAEAESKRAAFEAQIASLQAESDRIASTLRSAPGNSGPAVSPGRGILMNPVPGAPVTSHFGNRIHPIFGTARLHAGQDYGVSIGTPLRAAADGTVATAGWVSGYGNYTCINHGGGLASCYAHQSSIDVHVGQKVSRGQVIGKSGNTGNSTGPHLHFEVRVNGNPVDPRGYL